MVDGGPAALARFKTAQASPEAGFDAALREVRAGGKRGHWIWYIFPQLSGLGTSDASRYFGLQGAREAAAFLRDPELRQRLVLIADAVATQLRTRSPSSVRRLMGSDIDARKLVSSLTLFRHVAQALHASEGLKGCADLAAAADEILAAAAAEGYPPCAETLRRLQPDTPA